MSRVEEAVCRLVRLVLNEDQPTTLQRGQTFPWLRSVPSEAECGPLWPLVQQLYTALTGRPWVPGLAPPRPRKVDAYYQPWNFILEVDGPQHFTQYRRLTLALYPPTAPLGFDRAAFQARCRAVAYTPGLSFGRPRPPYFPGPNGRHQERALRDALTDLLPPLYGLRPTVRLAPDEVAALPDGLTDTPASRQALRRLLRAKGLPLTA